MLSLATEKTEDLRLRSRGHKRIGGLEVWLRTGGSDIHERHESRGAMWVKAGEVQRNNCAIPMEKLRKEMQGPTPELPRGAAGGSRAVLNTLRQQWMVPLLTARSALAGVHTV